MSNQINDGGPAFPAQDWQAKGNHHPGMTLRDYFAAAALEPLVTSAIKLDHAKWDATVQHAYLIADAMLRAREVKP